MDKRFFEEVRRPETEDAAEAVMTTGERIRRIDDRLWSVLEAMVELGRRLSSIERELSS